MKRFTDTKAPASHSYAHELFAERTIQDWEEYFLILETLEEKQVHIVKQIMNKLPQLVRFHPTWVFIIYRRFFTHQHITVVKWGLEIFLQTHNLSARTYAGAIQAVLTTDLLEVNEPKLKNCY